jgi:preprotein translocase subunit SecF
MEFFKTDTKIDFMGQRKLAAIVSIVLCLSSFVIFFVKGLNLGLDFTGGTQIEASYDHAADIDEIRSELTKIGFGDAIVQPYGSSTEVLVRLADKQNMPQKELKEKVIGALKGGTVKQVEYIGPQVGQQLVTNGILAIVVSLIATMIYIAIRFEYRFAISAIAALIHDPVVTLGVFSLFQIEFNLITLAAVLTIIG